MELVHKKGDLVPLRGMPEEVLNDKILNNLAPWLSQLLAIDDNEKNVTRLEVLLPMIKESAWSMSISEIKKAFLMYAKGELPLEPRDNYLTAILFSKVIKEYKKTLMTTQKNSPVEIIENEIIIAAYNYYKGQGEIGLEREDAFDMLLQKGIFKQPEEIGSKGKTWASWYNKMMFRAKDRVIKTITSKGEQYKKEYNQAMDGKHSLSWRYGKLECLKAWFKTIESEQELLNKIQ